MDRSISIAISERPVSKETANQLTHGFGFLLSIIGAAVLMIATNASKDALQIAGCYYYAISMVALYGASTLSHSFERPKLRRFFRMLDQICIFLFIAFSFTCFGMVHLRDGNWWTLLAVIWIFAFVGIGFRLFRQDHTISTMCYVILGWLPIIAIEKIAQVGDVTGLVLIIAGGLSYMLGTVFLAADEKYPYFHAIWHLLVIVGSVCHFLFLLNWVAMWQPAI
jgi:hemolysin III